MTAERRILLLTPPERELVERALDTYIREVHRIRIVEERVLAPHLKAAIHDEIERADQLRQDIRDERKG